MSGALIHFPDWPLGGCCRQRLDIAAPVRLAVRADVMRPLGAMADRALVHARRLQAMRRPALVAARLRCLFLGDGHRRANIANIGAASGLFYAELLIATPFPRPFDQEVYACAAAHSSQRTSRRSSAPRPS